MSDNPPSPNPPAFVPPVSTFTGPVGELIAQRMLAPPPRPGVLAVLDHFEILRLLGGGGMGMVLLARDSLTGREVAIKLVKSELVTNQHAIHRFLKETNHLKRLRHTNIVPVEEISDRPEGPYLVMPYFEKGSLANRIKPGQPLSTDVIFEVAIQVAEGLSFAHRSGIIHRDLKPANILLGARDLVCLADFGLARSVFNDTIVDVESRQLEGTAPYMSPAIAAGDAEDTRCDIYSFGALLYEMLTGLPPYEGRGAKEILDQILAGPPKPILSVNPSADRGLAAVAEGCMARELRERYADMRDVLSDLRLVQKGKAPVGRPVGSSVGRAPSPLAIGIAIAAFALLASAGAVFVHNRSNSTAHPETNAPAPESNAVAISQPIPIPTNTNNTSALVVSNTNATTIAPTNAVVVATTNEAVSPMLQTQPTNSALPTNWPATSPPTNVQYVTQTNLQRTIVTDIVRLNASHIGESVISGFAKSHLPDPPLTASELDYLGAQGVPAGIVDIFRRDGGALTLTNQPPASPPAPAPSLASLVSSANQLYESRYYRQAIEYCDRALEQDPRNADATCVKAACEDSLRNKAEAIRAFARFLALPEAKTSTYAKWRLHAQNRLKALRGW